jgi:hypothetical protein
MKTKFKFTVSAACHSFGGVVCAGAVMLIASSAQAQNLFEADSGTGNIYEFTPGGVRTTFASGAGNPNGLVFDSAGNLFEADHMGNIYEFTPGGVRSTFASGLNQPAGLAFDTTGNLFVAGGNQSGYIYTFTPGGVRSTFTTAVNNPVELAFDNAGNLFEADYNGQSI